ncbi:transposase family protein [Micromonospora aurantiaca]|uniref:transposase family protein n=1 Tax=Micromonospora aurantiaca (nom. illeg.) TaxID=47850 RepID=UPI00339E71A0
MLTYPATIPLSTRSLNHLAELLRTHRARRGTRYRRLDHGRQALLVLAHLRNGDTPARPPARLAGGFGVGATTAWRGIREAVDLLAAQAPTLAEAMDRIGRLAYAILDGTLIRTDRLSGEQDRRHFAGKHRCHGVNTQVIADPAGRLARVSPALPGSTHDLTAARYHGIIDALTEAQVMTFADKGYRGARGTIVVPFYGRNLPEPMHEVNRSHAKIRAIGERAIATVKNWKLLAKLHCCPRRATPLLAAILVLQLVEEQRYSG